MEEYGALLTGYWQRETGLLGEESVPVSLCSPQMPRDKRRTEQK
jgi:hypothetical protein